MSHVRRLARTAALALALLALGAGAAVAENVAFFDNPAFTDPIDESAALSASLVALGHTVNPFSGIAAGDWSAAVAANDLLVIPELDVADLYPQLSADARTVLADYVSGGGCLLMFDRSSSDPRSLNLINGIYGFSLTGSPGGESYLDAGAAAGTPFAGGPAVLPDADAVEGVASSSLPPTGIPFYEDNAGGTMLFTAAIGSGKVVWLGFDWYELPTPAAWQEVLGRAVEACAEAPSVVEIPTLDGVGLGLLALVLASAAFFALGRRRRTA